MLWAVADGRLEVRAERDGSHRVSGRFPYGQIAELGPRRREVFAGGAFRRRVIAGEEIHLLVAHDFARPIASTRAGSLTLKDGDDVLSFEARIDPEIAETTHGRDALAMIRGRLATGVSPGFIVTPDGEEVVADGDGLRRTVRAADLHELSIVTRPAYPAAQVEARCWRPTSGRRRPQVLRWRP
jgi:uncharacterized protein